ncbi:MAG TPA: M13-type metalloendopeptidase [Kineosporiaceae bacterium]
MGADAPTGTASGIEVDRLTSQYRPQDDLYRYVNGSWLRDTAIPDDKAVYGAFHMLADKAEADVRAILEEAAASDAPEGSDQRKIGDLYAAFLDREAAERLGADPIAADLALIDGAADREGLVRVLGALARGGIGGGFHWWVNTDAKASDRYIVYLHQGGIGLPDEAYYREDSFAAVREAYVAHIGRMLALAGRPDPDDAARRVFDLEHTLAASHWDRVTARDATKAYTKLDRSALQELTPGFDWALWLEAQQARPDALDEVVVRQPSYLEAFAATLEKTPLEDWKAWLAWRVVHGTAPFLSSEFVDENFAFYGTTLSGTPQLRERWKRAVSTVEGVLGEAVGKLYVERRFPPAAKERMGELVAHLTEAYRQRISALDWMGDDTKARALAKLEQFTPKVGYPDEWRDYSRLQIVSGDLVGNLRRGAAFELERELGKLGKPVDRAEWFMTPQTVNAYYNPGLNEIVFPAAILQPPFFDLAADDAVNYGGIGAVIGHEIGHGFDDQGSKYDGSGNLVDWWTDDDRARFEARTKALISQYDVLEPELTPGHHVNGALTIGENIGDLGGLAIALVAYRIALRDGEGPVLDGLTAAQRFFLGWAQVWRTKTREAETIRRLAVDPHSPPEFRCNAVVRNIDAFHEAFGVTADDALWLDPADRVRIW